MRATVVVDMPPRASSVDRLQEWVGRYQRDAASCGADLDRACAALVRIAKTVPRDLAGPEREIARGLLNDAWDRVLTLLMSPSSGADDSGARDAAVADHRAAKAMGVIDRQFPDTRLTLSGVARQLAVSPSHLTHLMKLTSGRTFGAQLHVRRIAEACSLLAESRLSVKEVASRVGYATTTQLDRHFKKIVRCLPSEFRAVMRRTRMTRGGDSAEWSSVGPSTTQSTTHSQK